MKNSKRIRHNGLAFVVYYWTGDYYYRRARVVTEAPDRPVSWALRNPNLRQSFKDALEDAMQDIHEERINEMLHSVV